MPKSRYSDSEHQSRGAAVYYTSNKKTTNFTRHARHNN